VDLIASIGNWWHRERQYASARKLFALGWEFLRESLPDRRRQRYGDVEYDWEYRVDTTSATVGWGTRLRGLLHSPYQPVDPELFRRIMNSLEIDFSKFTFVDIGSGKGRALLLASEHPFDRVMGIELLPELDQIARENIRKFSASRRCSDIEAVLADATEFNFPHRPLVVFLFHPLPEGDFCRLMTNLVGSSHKFPRPIYLIYAHHVFENLVAAWGIFEKVDGNEQYSLFRTLPAA
jgi:hypothetical protein